MLLEESGSYQCYGYGIKEMESGLCVGDVALFLLKVGTECFS